MKTLKVKNVILFVVVLFVVAFISLFYANNNYLDRYSIGLTNENDSEDAERKVTLEMPLSPAGLNPPHLMEAFEFGQVLTEKERRKLWEENFPWQPTHDPNLKFDPARHFTGRSGNHTGNYDRPTNTEMATAGNHYVLKNFFNDDVRLSSQFEKFYNILKEYGRGHNPAEAAGVFWALRRYYHTEFENEPEGTIDEIGIQAGLAVFGETTYSEAAARELENLKGRLMGWEWMDQRFFGEAGQAELMGLIERLTTEIDDFDELPVSVMPYGGVSGMADNSAEAQGLLSGEEELLVPYVGWNEQSENYHGTQNRQFQASYEQGDPSLKAAAPELFPPVGVNNGRLVDKDGDPVKWSESMGLTLINERGERVPAIVEEDGSVSLPTPEEVEVMRQSGEVQPATVGEVAPIIRSILKMNRESQ